MNQQEFMEKVEGEGMAYAFTEYGLSESDLDTELQNTPFYAAVADARRAYCDADALGNRLWALME